MLRQTVTITNGIDIETARKVVKLIKDTKLKVQAAIQGDEVRVTGKARTICRRPSHPKGRRPGHAAAVRELPRVSRRRVWGRDGCRARVAGEAEGLLRGGPSSGGQVRMARIVLSDGGRCRLCPCAPTVASWWPIPTLRPRGQHGPAGRSIA